VSFRIRIIIIIIRIRRYSGKFACVSLNTSAFVLYCEMYKMSLAVRNCIFILSVRINNQNNHCSRSKKYAVAFTQHGNGFICPSVGL